MKVELEENLGISDVSPEHLQFEILGVPNDKAYIKISSEKRQIYGYYLLFMCYAKSSIRDFEKYFIIVVGSDEDDFQILLN